MSQKATFQIKMCQRLTASGGCPRARVCRVTPAMRGVAETLAHSSLRPSAGVRTKASFGISDQYLQKFCDLDVNSKKAWQGLFMDGYLDDSIWDRTPNAKHVCSLLGTSRHDGIKGSSQDLERRRYNFGSNVVPAVKQVWLVALISAMARRVLGFLLEACLNVAQRTSQVKVLRDGQWIRTPPEDMVVGDIQLLSAGETVTADCALLEGEELSTDESPLTNAAVPVTKTVTGDFRAFAGSTVHSGQGVMLVLAVGQSTQQAKLAVLSKAESVVIDAEPITPAEDGWHDRGQVSATPY